MQQVRSIIKEDHIFVVFEIFSIPLPLLPTVNIATLAICSSNLLGFTLSVLASRGWNTPTSTYFFWFHAMRDNPNYHVFDFAALLVL
jgi:hypothetical protein